jgi:hypothetical protein
MARGPRCEPKEGTLTINHKEEVRWAQPFPRTQQRPARLAEYTKLGPRFNRNNGEKPARPEALGLRVVGVGMPWHMRVRRPRATVASSRNLSTARHISRLLVLGKQGHASGPGKMLPPGLAARLAPAASLR